MEGVFNIEIKFTMCNLVMTFEIQRRMYTTVNYVSLISENEINT